jgi:hypothetical protein
MMFIVSTAVLAHAADAPQATAPQPTAPPEPAGMVQLFNGKDLDGWDGDQRLWSVKDGVLRGETTKENPTTGNTFLIWKGGELGDFDLRLKFKLRNHNSGVQYRSQRLPSDPKNNPWGITGYQAEIDNTPGKAGYLYHEKGRKQLCFVGEKVEMDAEGNRKVVGSLGEKDAIAKTYKPGDWNDYVIIGRGNHIMHFVNGIQTMDLVDNDPKGRAMSGLLALQMHAGDPMLVEFKDIRLKNSAPSHEAAPAK